MWSESLPFSQLLSPLPFFQSPSPSLPSLSPLPLPPTSIATSEHADRETKYAHKFFGRGKLNPIEDDQDGGGINIPTCAASAAIQRILWKWNVLLRSGGTQVC